MVKNCKICNCKLLKRQKYFCSNICKFKYFKKYKVGYYFNKKIQGIGGKNVSLATRKKIVATNKRNKTGFFNPNMSKIGNDSQKVKKTGFYNSKLQAILGKKGGKIGGPIVVKILREKKGNIFNNINFDSKGEMEFALNINYQLEKIREGKNYQIKVGSKIIDFYIDKFKCFIEYHPHNLLYDKVKDDYFIKRRKVLNENGYKYSNLVVIQ